ncbi:MULTISPECIES: helix-turn-helix domain-containing protein [Clostridium]|uniref:helix-turn-helix domain-containing protein n=1 Tax=Clostridium TaxID=1485 RepID=UPI0015E1AF3C|nr:MULTISPECIES: AraC family transcriptional regulator [Clostridium]MBN7575974.1 helix-turn-helix transcriptional regulator [Clostridium beijerinckii]MBN7581108.1 helix-turn-helix transcriptional regulator [Clostridium beijerinckii]MBN7585695.1 helix-turn-helix transcriptional regulator [Clostridium beijerinckii]MBO0521569.1 helix-turn-helix transcriptional regulator [Clostridium beijerinckii]
MERIDIPGCGSICMHEIFPGIVLNYEEFKCKELSLFANEQVMPKISGEMIEIGYCHEGRIQCEFEGGVCVYMGSGDLYAGLMGKYPPVNTFPMAEYKGISIYIYIDEISKCLPEILKGAMIDIKTFQKRLFSSEKYFVKVGNCINWVGGKIERIFLDLFSLPDLPEAVIESYLKIKVLELILLLNENCANENETKNKYYLKAQTEIVKNVHDELIKNPSNNLTLKQLSEKYNISQSGLSNCFKAIYGKSIAKYIKDYRIEYAASLLRKTDETVMNISATVGYENQSKFAAAFKEVIGVNPTEYRKGDMDAFENLTL